MYRSIFVALFVFIVLLLTGCADNPVDGTEDDHAEVEGAVLFRDDQEIVRITDAVVSGDPGLISVGIGESAVITVQWLDEEGDEVHDEDLHEAEYTLIVRDHDVQLLAVELVDGERWSFRVTGLAEGTTSVRIALDHNGHDDFLAPLITVQVSEEQAQP